MNETTDGRTQASDYGQLGPTSLAGVVVRVLGEDRWGRVRLYWPDKDGGLGEVDVEFSSGETDRLPRNRVISAYGVHVPPEGYRVPSHH